MDDTKTMGGSGRRKKGARRMIAKTIRAGIVAVGFLACSGSTPAVEEEETPSGAACSPGEGLSYDSFGRSFMASYCTRCHSSALAGPARNGAPPGHDFDSYLGVLAVAEHIDEFAAAGPESVNETMPVSDPRPTLEERQRLGRWLACEIASAADGGASDGN